MSGAPVVIAGAGLAGLACGLELQRHNIPFIIFEASDGPGGRVRTDAVDGFLLDRGFQVYLTAYPEGKRVLDYKALQFGRFVPGAMVRLNGKFHRVMDPWREPFAALSGLLNPVGSMADKLLVARLRAACMAGKPEDVLARPETTSMAALKRYGFSDNMIERFFQPFFGGIMLDAQLQVSSRMLEYVFRMMASGDTVLPAKGMGAIPRQLAAKLPEGSIEYGVEVQAVAAQGVRLSTGEEVPARAVVVATGAGAARRLLPGLPALQARKALCLYFAVPGAPPISDPIIVFNGNLEWPVHNLCVPSLVCPTYAPKGQHLLCVTVLGDPAQDDAAVESQVRKQLDRWLGQEANRWPLLKIYRIRDAHPTAKPSTVTELPARVEDGLYVCGDHRFFPSIQAALVNGRNAAEAVIQDHG